jgi:hypothetical protein
VLLRLEIAEGGVVGGLEIYDGANPAAPLAEVSGDGLGIHLFRPSLSRLYIGIRCAPNRETLEACGLRSYRAWAVPDGTRDAPSWLAGVSGAPVPEPSAVITVSNAGGVEPLVEWGDGEILHIQYSPDGELLLVATTLGGIHLLETVT